jgi:hypothetical protein
VGHASAHKSQAQAQAHEPQNKEGNLLKLFYFAQAAAAAVVELHARSARRKIAQSRAAHKKGRGSSASSRNLLIY